MHRRMRDRLCKYPSFILFYFPAIFFSVSVPLSLAFFLLSILKKEINFASEA